MAPISTMARVRTVAFAGLEVRDVDVEVQLASGLPAFTLVGLPDKALAESRERVRGALGTLGISLPPKRIVINLAPADLAKEGSHFDLPIALGLLVVLGLLPPAALENHLVLGELALDGTIRAVHGVLPAALAASERKLAMICPGESGGEAAWLAGEIDVVAAASLAALINHLRGVHRLVPPEPALAAEHGSYPDLKDVKGQETAKRAIEIAAAGHHHLLMSGPPGSGKSMLAARLPGIMPPLDPTEVLEVSMIASMAGRLEGGRLTRRRPFRNPHHGSSMAALVGGGSHARPGEISLAHKGVLFLDELPEFQRNVLDALRQPLETGQITVSRAAARATYPARFQLIAAMNPCRCGHLGTRELQCAKAPRCADDYMARISGPLFDRIDLMIEVPAVAPADLLLPAPAEDSAIAAARVAAARDLQSERFAKAGRPELRTNAEAEGEALEAIAPLDPPARQLLERAATHLHLTARSWHRVIRVARTIADLDGSEIIRKPQIAEALAFRRHAPRRG